MKKGFLALSLFLLLTLASQATWCDAERSHAINGARLRPHLQFEELHVTDGKKLGQAADTDTDTDTESHKHHDEVKVPMRMAIAHKGGGRGGGVGGGVGGPGGGTGVGGRNVNGAADTRPVHNGRSNAAAMPAPAKATASVLALAFACAIVLSAFSF
ncbi:uncharacterized protein [Oryza sativa Japonica Group]|uniref:uncharacterized protein n=1 Tax=Oryza sativa subsp. japonica TaxID=39947 RepID=UPI00001D8D7E|nr:protein no-on-transient A [Oryza sativa Japonica Group]KAF2918917.1 hypothetical protein DAI22_08g095600 [Oryza sativa Japonica Group]